METHIHKLEIHWEPFINQLLAGRYNSSGLY
jgi:hypothetical protein